MILPTFNTEKSDALCREIAKRSNGVCFLMMSCGKDSLCAWLQLRRYFTRIIPFHCGSIPGLEFRKRMLDYYEYEFQTKILRLMGEDLLMALVRYVYQESPWMCDMIDDELDVDDYSKLDILGYLRMRYNLPRAWCACGISMYDSIDRMIYCRKTGGRSDENRTFYPCFDWPKKEILNAIRESGLKVSAEYRYAKRSIGGVPSATYNAILKEHFPRDWERLLRWYPLAEAKNYREALLAKNRKDLDEKKIAERGGKSSDDAMVDSETDVESKTEDDKTVGVVEIERE